ncbi:MAG: YeiH family protein [Janthinobacterium lividum]
MIQNILAPSQTKFSLSLPARQALFIAAAAFCLTPLASPAVALALGMALALTLENPYPIVSKHTAKILLQACVVALGFGMNLAVVLQAGKSGMLFAAGSITGTLILGYLAGRFLEINTKTSALITAGTAICGGSAIAAVGSVIGAAEGEMTVAMGTVFLLNAVALYVFPILGHALHLSQTQFGTWAGIAIHDISSVVGASARYGLPALQTATAVKLSRALWIVPVALGAALTFQRSHSGITATTIGFDPNQTPSKSQGKLQIPWFIGLFLLASLARSFVPGIAAASPVISHSATIGLTLTLFLIGSGISQKTLRVVGWKPMAQGILLWLVISAGSLLVILHTIR